MEREIDRKIRVFVVDDHPMMLVGIREIISGAGQVELVGTATSAEEALASMGALSPDIIILDIALPGMSGFAAAKMIRRSFPDIGIIFLTMHTGEEFIQEFMRSAADGYVLKNNPPEELLQAIKTVYRKEFFISPSLSTKVIREHRRYRPEKDELTDREMEVLVLVARGMSSKQIAGKLCVSTRTVGKYREGIMQKLDLHTVADLTKYAIHKKLIGVGSR